MATDQSQRKSSEDERYARMVDFYLKGRKRENTGIWDLPLELIYMIAEDFDNKTLCRFAATSQRHWKIFKPICHKIALRGEIAVKEQFGFGHIEISPFNKAVKQGYQAAVRSFLRHGLKPDSNYSLFPLAKLSRSALNEAMYLLDDPMGMCELLLSGGADPYIEKPGREGYTPERAPIKQAAKDGNSALVCLFLDYGANIPPGDPIYYDIFLMCDVTVVSRIIENGFDLRSRLNRSHGYFRCAATNVNGRGVLDYLATLYARKLFTRQINGYNVGGCQSLLCDAISWGRQENVQALLDSGADPNARISISFIEDLSPLMLACTHNQEIAVSALIWAGADINFRRKDGFQAIHFAAEQSARITEMLLKAGADVRSVTQSGSTPLHIACEPVVGSTTGRSDTNNSRSPDIVNLLLAWGAPIDVVDSGGLTPVDVAKNSGRYDLVLAM